MDCEHLFTGECRTTSEKACENCNDFKPRRLTAYQVYKKAKADNLTDAETKQLFIDNGI